MERTQTEKEIRDLVEKAASGDRESVSTLLKTFTSDMYFITRLYVGNKNTARSSEQTALRNALRNLRDSVSADSFEEWLGDIVRDTALENIPQVKVSDNTDLKYTNKDEIPDTGLILPEDKDECKIRILHALDTLPSSERVAAALRYYDLCSLDEISRKLNISKDDTRKLLASAKQILAEGDTGVSALLALASKVNPKLSFEDEPVVESDDEILEPGDFSLTDMISAVKEGNDELNDVDLSFKEPEKEEEEEFRIDYDDEEKKEENPFGDLSFEDKKPKEPEKDRFFDIPEEVDPEPTKVVESMNQVLQTADDDDDDYDKKPRKKKKGGFFRWFLPLLLIAALAGGAFYLFGIKGYTIDDIKSLIPGMNSKPAETVTPEPTPEATPTPTPEATPTPTPEATPTPEPTEEAVAGIGKAYTNVSDLSIRNGAGINYDFIEVAAAETEYDVFETAEADGYTWYRIGEDRWIPSEGTWITYTPNE